MHISSYTVSSLSSQYSMSTQIHFLSYHNRSFHMIVPLQCSHLLPMFLSVLDCIYISPTFSIFKCRNTFHTYNLSPPPINFPSKPSNCWSFSILWLFIRILSLKLNVQQLIYGKTLVTLNIYHFVMSQL